MILLSAIELRDCTAAYNWHRGFAGANDALCPRDFERLVMEGSVWAARSTDLDYLAHAYASLDEATKVMEIGGLMVAVQTCRKGLGALMMRLALSHALVERDLLADPEVRIVAHVLKSNQAPRTVIDEQLRFRLARMVEIPKDELPGLRVDEDGIVRGDEFEIAAGVAGRAGGMGRSMVGPPDRRRDGGHRVPTGNEHAGLGRRPQTARDRPSRRLTVPPTPGRRMPPSELRRRLPQSEIVDGPAVSKGGAPNSEYVAADLRRSASE